MSPLDTATVVRRIDELLAAQLPHDTSENVYAAVVEEYQSTLTIVGVLYGAASSQAQALLKAADDARKKTGLIEHNFPRIRPVVQGTLRAMRSDVEAGFLGSIERRAAGEVLGDMLGLAKEALAIDADGTRNVAAVLAAAAFEDTIRKMGAAFDSILTRPDLGDVLAALKKSGTLTGAPFTTAQSYLKFRNDALHADWSKLNSAVVGSCISFVEHLLLQHFS